MRGVLRDLRNRVRAAGFWLAVLACRVLRVRFLVNPVYPPSLTRIGHLAAEPDCFVKEGILGLRRWCIGVILIERERAANPCLLDYWRQRLRVVSSPFWVRLLTPLADVRALRRSPGTALRAFSPWPRAQYRSSYSLCGRGAASEVTTKRRVSPAAMTSALSTTRQGRDHAAAAE